MTSTTYRNIFYGLALIGIVIIMIIPDVVIGLLFELVHFFFELLIHIIDISTEWIESILDKIVERLFDTDLHQTQIIVFYLMMGMAVLPLYYLWRMLRRLFFRLKETLHVTQAAWTLYKTRATLYWQDLSLIDKIKLFVITAGAIYLAFFLFM